ncbi:MAG: urease accessory protein UreD [Burkholderiaceae bacterium]
MRAMDGPARTVGGPALAPAALAAYGGGWPASLQATVRRAGQRSVLGAVAHRGPLRLQKALWPEGGDPVHLLLLHPPGGIAGGDSLQLDLQLTAGAQALLTTPGAGHWYRADSPATQHASVRLAAGAALEWLPQETIVHDGAQADSTLHFELDASACLIGFELTVLGRRAAGERFERGSFRQRLSLRRGGTLLLHDDARIAGGLPRTAAVLGGRHVSGLLWAVGPDGFDEDLVQAVETAMTGTGAELAGATQAASGLLLARVVESSPELARRALVAAWQQLRLPLLGRAARTPRIWMT